MSVRRELFKYFYDEGIFSLYQSETGSSANDAIYNLQNIIHQWEEQAYNAKCSATNGAMPCFVHLRFKIKLLRKVNCCNCATNPLPIKSEDNMFSVQINARELCN